MFTEEELRLLIRVRPDLFYPTPPTQAALVSRLSLYRSVSRALQDLNAADLHALEVLADAGAEFESVSASELGIDVTRLAERMLVHIDGDAVHIAPGTLSALPHNWRVSDTAPENLDELIAGLSDRERKVLETLAAANGIGTSSASAPRPGSPVAMLVDKKLLIRVDDATVRLPRPVRDALAGRTPTVFPLTPPPPPDVDQHAVDQAAAAAGLETVRQMSQLLTRLLVEPVQMNKDDTLGVRALASLTKELGFDPSLHITIGESAGLLAGGWDESSSDYRDILAATREGVEWLDSALPDQWAALLTGWVASHWLLEDGERVFSPDTYNTVVRYWRWDVLAAGGDREQLLFNRPLSAMASGGDRFNRIVAEGQAVGALALGAASAPALALLEHGEVAAVAAAAAPLVPPEVDQLIAQADMTLLAPGPLVAETARVLERFAELESPGLASVWRVSEASIRGGFDRGLTADALHDWLGQHIIGEVPQAITFLIDDIFRNHGLIRAGAAMSYIRSADASLITNASSFVPSLRVLAPTVAVSELPLTQLVAELRKAGFQPAAENAQGATISLAPKPVLVRGHLSPLPEQHGVDPAEADRIVELLLANPGAGPDGASDIAETLRAAARGRRPVSLGYVDSTGRGQAITVVPLSVTAGQVDALDEATDRVVRIPLPRITRAHFA